MDSNHSRTAYILQVHDNPEQVNQFIYQLISSNQADVYVHIDKKSYERIKGKIIEGPNVKVLKKIVNCEWGDISQVDATLLLLKEVVDSKKDYDFVCLRSGQDLLVRNGFKQFLSEHRGQVFMSYRELAEVDHGLTKIKWPKMIRRRYTTSHPYRIYRRILLELFSRGINPFPNQNEFPTNYTLYKGSQWFTIPLEVAKYCLQFLKENEWYYQFFENTLVPDESFFHTLILNSPYKEKVMNCNLYYIKWGETVSERNSPQFLRKEDIAAIVQSKMFFARKFDISTEAETIQYFTSHVKIQVHPYPQKIDA